MLSWDIKWPQDLRYLLTNYWKRKTDIFSFILRTFFFHTIFAQILQHRSSVRVTLFRQRFKHFLLIIFLEIRHLMVQKLFQKSNLKVIKSSKRFFLKISGNFWLIFCAWVTMFCKILVRNIYFLRKTHVMGIKSFFK